MEILTNLSSADAELGDWLYPDFGDNLEKKEDKRAAFYAVPMEGKELKRHRESNIERTRGRDNKDLFAASSRREWKLMKKVLLERIKDIRNVSGKDAATGEKTPITKIDVLIDAVERGSAVYFDLLEMLYEAITDISKFDEMTAKKSESESGSSSPETGQSKNEGAPSANLTGSTTPTDQARPS